MTHTLMICDDESVYAEKLANYINSTDDYLFEARFCNDLSEVTKYLEDDEIDILLVMSRLYKKAVEIMPVERIEILYGREGESDKTGIYKYQSCEDIMRYILQKAAGIKEIGGIVTRKSPMKIVGLYSPVKRCYQSTLSIILGQLFGQSGKTLYINLEGYSSVSELTGIEFEKDMSDILYDMGNGSGNVAAIIGGTVNNFGTVSILPPMRSVKDLKSIAYTEWKSFLLKLEMGTDYQYIILDISDNVENPDSVIGLCEYLLVAVGTDKVAEKKVEQFLSDLKKEFDEDGRLQIIKYIIPRVDRVDSKMLRTPGNPIWDYAEKELIVNING